MDILKIEGLRKRFGDKTVLNGLELAVPANSVFGFVGKNGAGKTTTMKLVLGLLRADEGDIFVDGKRVRFGQNQTNRLIGYLPDVPSFYGFLTAREYLLLCGECLDMERAEACLRSEELLSLVGLKDERHRIKGYSRGMKQRLGIAQALLNRPKLLICDEPTSALDPIGRREILDLLSSVSKDTTVLFSTHILSDVERICTDVAFLNDGKILRQGSVKTLCSGKLANKFTVKTKNAVDADILSSMLTGWERIDRDELLFVGGEEHMHAVMTRIAEHRIPIVKIERAEPSLESVFLEVAK